MAARLRDHYDVLFIGDDGKFSVHILRLLTSTLQATLRNIYNQGQKVHWEKCYNVLLLTDNFSLLHRGFFDGRGI